MLEKLDEIKWDELKTSFGRPAKNVGENIRNLLSSQAKVREEAIEELRLDICNTYIVVPATLVSVPFLIELLQSEQTADKQHILYLLKDCFDRTEATPEKLKNPNIKLDVDIGQAINKGLDTYIDLLKHDDWKVRLASASLLATKSFPKREWTRIEAIYQDFKTRETHPDVQKYFDKWDKYRLQYRIIEKPSEQAKKEE